MTAIAMNAPIAAASSAPCGTCISSDSGMEGTLKDVQARFKTVCEHSVGLYGVGDGRNRAETPFVRDRHLLRRLPMPRAYWKGYLRLSLVTCPIELFPASSQAEKTHFHQINKRTGNRLRQQMVDEDTGRVVE